MTRTSPKPHTEAIAARRPLSASVVVVVLLALCTAKIVLAVWLYDRTRAWLHHDDYCRSLMSLDWAESPYLYPCGLHWLPLPFYLYGLAAKLGFSDHHLVFVAISQILGVFTTIGVYWLTVALFSRTAGLIAASLHAMAAWVAVMSQSALAEPLYYLLIVFGVGAFLRWWIRLRPYHLLAAAICLTLAAATRYEAWLLIALISTMVVWRLLRTGAGRRQVLISLALLLVAWSVPVGWMIENLRTQGVLLAFYDALYQLTPIMRVSRYPLAFVLLSPILTVLIICALMRVRSWKTTGAGILNVIALGHLSIMTLLYASGSGPAFVERIVLTHLILLLPLCGELLAQCWISRKAAARLLVPALLIILAVGETFRAHDMIISERHSDYADLSDKYEDLLPVIAETLREPDALVAVNTSDSALFLKFRASAPARIHDVTADNARKVFAMHDFTMLCLPSEAAGRLKTDDRIEQTFRDHHVKAVIHETRHGYWRVLRIGEAAAAGGGRR